MLPDDAAEARAAYRAFADEAVRPHADRFDREEILPRALIDAMAERGYLGAAVPAEWGGAGLDPVAVGCLHEAVGGACSSARSLLTVHGMVCHAILRCGSAALRERWLPALAGGHALGAFAVTEPAVGSDAQSVETTAVADGDDWIVHGRKKWITFGEIANLFLILARSGEQPVALLVEADRAGVSRAPLRGMLGTRASMLAEVAFDGCRVPAANMLGRPGFGFGVIGEALDVGRFSVAWGCVGIGQACLEASERYSRERRQFGKPIGDHQLVQRMLADMITGVRAARLLCLQAATSRARGDAATVMDTLVAKYYASTMAMRAASDAVQIHGANGCSPDYPVARYLRDAKTMEIIEGSTEIQQILIARHARGEV